MQQLIDCPGRHGRPRALELVAFAADRARSDQVAKGHAGSARMISNGP